MLVLAAIMPSIKARKSILQELQDIKYLTSRILSRIFPTVGWPLSNIADETVDANCNFTKIN